MRMIGKLESERLARRISDHLLVTGIENEVARSSEGGFNVWVIEDRELERAAALLQAFQADPDGEPYLRSEAEAERRRATALRKDDKQERRRDDARKTFYRKTLGSTPWVSTALGALAIAVAAATHLGKVDAALQPFTITAYEVIGDRIRYLTGLPEVRSGDVWRLFTPVLIHFGALHLVFNLLWLADLGWKVERRRGSLYFAALALVISVPSNLAQYLASGPAFGGLSGLVFGLVGYVWTRNRCARRIEYPFSNQTLVWMLVWFGICTFGIAGPIANWAHGVGLVVGALWGACAGLWSHRRRRRSAS
jgi:rhomboid protease GlpG